MLKSPLKLKQVQTKAELQYYMLLIQTLRSCLDGTNILLRICYFWISYSDIETVPKTIIIQNK